MLIRFTVDNYRGFSKPITLDFTETHNYQFNKNCVKNGLLNKVVILNLFTYFVKFAILLIEKIKREEKL